MTIGGHDYYLGPYGTKASRIEYDRLISEWLAGGRHLAKPGTTDLSIAELSLAFLRYAKTYYVKDGQPTYCFAPTEAAKRRREARHSARKTPLSCGNTPGSNCKPAPKRRPKDRYTKDAYNRAIQRGCEAAFGMPQELRRIPKKTPKDEKKRLQKLAAQWRAKHCWSPNQLRHAAASSVRRQFGLEAAQVVLGHAKADVTQVYAERDQALAAEVMGKIG